MAVVVPAVLIARNGVDFDPLRLLLGVSLVVAGLLMWLWTVRLFARIGKGTLAPWDPTTHLVVEGPYAHVRNPMIAGVLAALVGEALVFGSTGIAIWALIFAAVNHVFFLVYEEPAVERRFGDEYRVYKRNGPALGASEDRLAA